MTKCVSPQIDTFFFLNQGVIVDSIGYGVLEVSLSQEIKATSL